MNATLYAATVLIWGTTWIAIAMQSGPVPSAVSVFYRFALASVLLLTVLLLSRRLRRIGWRDHLFCLLQGLCVFSFNFYCFYSANTYRLVFGSHGAESDRTFQGAINFSGVTQANLKLTFGVNATFRVTAVQLGVTSISSTGRLTQKID